MGDEQKRGGALESAAERLAERFGIERGEADAGLHARSMARTWHNLGMARTRVSTTVDEELLTNARGVCAGLTDAALIDRALAALLAQHRAADIDAAYAVYDRVPLDAADEWGDLASFRAAAGSS